MLRENNKHSLIYQNSDGAEDWLRRVGCFWRCGVNVAEAMTEHWVADVDELNNLWYITQDLMLETLTGPELYQGMAPITNFVLQHFGSTKRIVEVGMFQHGKTSFYGSYKAKLAEGHKPRRRYYIQKVKLPETYNEPFHYRRVSRNGRVVFDPYFPPPSDVSVVYSIIFEELV